MRIELNGGRFGNAGRLSLVASVVSLVVVALVIVTFVVVHVHVVPVALVMVTLILITLVVVTLVVVTLAAVTFPVSIRIRMTFGVTFVAVVAFVDRSAVAECRESTAGTEPVPETAETVGEPSETVC